MPPPLIHLENLTRNYGRRRGIADVSLSVPEGALFGFLGPNGAGKTTTIRVLLGLLRPAAGAARIFGLDCWRQSKTVKHDLGFLPGNLRLPLWMSGDSALSVFGAIRRRDLRAAGRTLAERFDLDLRVKVRQMSQGTRQKLGLVLALAPAPRLLILDEPTSALDPLMQRVLHEILRERAAAGHTVFFSSHSLGEVEQLCDRVAIIRDGRIVADESLHALQHRAGHEVTIHWTPGAPDIPAAPPAVLALTKHEPHLWQGSLAGPAGALIDFLAHKPVGELLITRPDLETLFARFYQKSPSPSS